MALHLPRGWFASVTQHGAPCTQSKSTFRQSRNVGLTQGVPSPVFLEVHAGPSSSHAPQPLRHIIAAGAPAGARRRHVRGAVQVGGTGVAGTAAGTEATFPVLKEFLEDLKGLGRVRAIVKTGLGILEWVTSINDIVYTKRSEGREIASVFPPSRQTEFHIFLNKAAKLRLTRGNSMRGDIPTYKVSILDSQDNLGATILLMWKPGTSGEYDPGQVEAFEALIAKYGEEVTLYDEGSEEASEL